MMSNCCGGMGIWMLLGSILGTVALVLLIVWLIKNIRTK